MFAFSIFIIIIVIMHWQTQKCSESILPVTLHVCAASCQVHLHVIGIGTPKFGQNGVLLVTKNTGNTFLYTAVCCSGFPIPNTTFDVGQILSPSLHLLVHPQTDTSDWGGHFHWAGRKRTVRTKTFVQCAITYLSTHYAVVGIVNLTLYRPMIGF